MKLFIPCRPEDVRIHPHGRGVVIELRPVREMKRPADAAVLVAEGPEDMFALAEVLKVAMPQHQFIHGRDSRNELVYISIYQPER